MRRVPYQIQKETWESMRKAQRYNQALEITFRDRTGSHTHTLSAGHSDDLHVYREDTETYVLSLNYSPWLCWLAGIYRSR